MASQAEVVSRLYERDFYLWARETAAALERREFSSVDFGALIEEVEGLARTERRALRSRLQQLLLHMLKWRYQPERRGVSWQLTIDEQRIQTINLLEENPSLTAELDSIIARAYPVSIRKAAKETRLPLNTFPASCPFTRDEIFTGQSSVFG